MPQPMDEGNVYAAVRHYIILDEKMVKSLMNVLNQDILHKKKMLLAMFIPFKVLALSIGWKSKPTHVTCCAA